MLIEVKPAKYSDILIFSGDRDAYAYRIITREGRYSIGLAITQDEELLGISHAWVSLLLQDGVCYLNGDELLKGRSELRNGIWVYNHAGK